MKFDAYWAKLEEATPQLKTSLGITMTIETLRKVAKKAFDAGAEEGESRVEDRRKAAEDFGKVANKGDHPQRCVCDVCWASVLQRQKMAVNLQAKLILESLLY